MNNSTTSQAEIAKVKSDVLRHTSGVITSVGQLEQALLDLFPAEDAEAWDRTGLLAGDSAKPLEGIAIALDATATAVKQAKECGANVLLTHHPAFIDPPQYFGPASMQASGAEAAIYQAIHDEVALINFHTALDVSTQAQQVLPSMLGLKQTGVLCPLEYVPNKGYGQVCSTNEQLTLNQLAARCTSVFSRLPRVWGNPSKQIDSLVTATGSGGSLLEACRTNTIDCLICGELRYHDALAAAEAGLCLIELGHDVSELPLGAVLAAACEQVGIDVSLITMLDQSGNWWTPEAIRR